jgi:AcrR family transcriptional regulator
MSWLHHTWCVDYVLPAAVSAAIAWVGLAREFSGKGRLLGSWASSGLMLLVLALMGAVAAGAVVLLPHAASIPPVIAGAATGVTALPRRKQDETAQPYIKFMTLGIALVRERLVQRVHLDACTWSDRFLRGIETSAQLRVFAHDLKLYLLERHPLAAETKMINAIYTDVETAIDVALDVQTRIDEACRQAEREPTDDELIARRQAFGIALAQCGHLLRFAYVHGRRSENEELRTLRAKAMSNDAFHSPALPPQRRWFDRWLTR